MGLMDKAMDAALDKLEDRFSELIVELNELDGHLTRIEQAQNRSNELLEQLVNKVGPS